MKEEVRLKRQLGLLHGVGIVAGLVIGGGIYISPQGVIVHAGSAGLSLVLWVVGGALSMLGALTYAEIGLIIPQSGALYAYMRVLYGRFAGFLYIWCYLFFVRVGANAIKCLMFGRYVLKPFFPDCPVPDIAVRLVASIVACKSASIDSDETYWSSGDILPEKYRIGISLKPQILCSENLDWYNNNLFLVLCILLNMLCH